MENTTTRWLMHWCVSGVVCALMVCGLGTGPSQAFDLRVSNDFSMTHNDVSGPGDDQSFLTEGTRYLNVLDVYGYGNLQDFQYNFNLGFKATDDPRNDSQSTSLTNLQGRITNQIHTATVGDTYEAFSQYSMNTAIKGVSYRYADNMNRAPDVSLLAGVAYSRWDNFWGVDTLERQVYGVRVRQELTRDLWIAANLVYSDDDDQDNLGMDEYETTTMGFDWEYLPIPGLTIRGESAWSDIDRTTPGAAVEISDNGHAHKIEAIGDGGPSRVSLVYERVSPDFLTLLGSATSDREKFKAQWRYRPTRTQTWTFGFLWYRDNLDGQLDAGRTDHYRPEIGVSLRQLFDRRYSVVNLNYKFDRAYGSRSTQDHFVTLGYRDRFGQFDSDTNVGVTVYDTTDRRDALEFFANTTLGTRKTFGDWILRPSIRLGAWTLENELQDVRDKTWDYSVGLGVDAPHLKINSNIRVGYNELRRGGGGETEKWFASLSAYYRPDFLARFNQGMLYLRGNVNDMSYDVSSRDFRENSITAGIRIQI